MSISNVASSTAALQTLRTNFQDQKNYLDQLQQSVTSGDLNGAQQAYDSLSKLVQSGPGAQNGQPFGGNTTLQKDFQALGDALKSGDQSTVQKAFAQFTQDLQAARQAHKGHHHQKAQDSTAANTSTSQTTDAGADGDGSTSLLADGNGTSVNLTV